jgi:ribosome biogenesis GTPase / thiamine phosphate phosphatase
MSLQDLGWDAHFDGLWRERAELGHVPARVVSQHRGLWRIVGDFEERWAAPSGKMRLATAPGSDWPAVGDWVAAEVPDGEQQATMHAVLPRRSQFVRKTAGKRVAQQVLVANVDTAFIVVALDGDFNLRRLERYLAQGRESGAAPVILLNKADDCAELAKRIAEVEHIAMGIPVFALSARYGHAVGALDPFLSPGKTVVLLGSSGAGKSTLVNRLMGEDRQQVGEIRESDSRGRHTTTSRDLLLLPGGAMVIDTPGLRELQLWDASEGVAETFADVDELATLCRFGNCRHENEPGCAIQEALAAGTLDPARLENRRKLEREGEFLLRKLDPHATKEEKHKIKIQARGIRQKKRQDEGGKQ